MKSSCDEYVTIQIFKETNKQTQTPKLNVGVSIWTWSNKTHFRLVQNLVRCFMLTKPLPETDS